MPCFDTKHMTQQHPLKIGLTKRWWQNLTWNQGVKCCKDRYKFVLVIWDFDVAHWTNAFFSPMFAFAYYHSLLGIGHCWKDDCMVS